MSSNGPDDRLDLDRDLPTSPEDVAALRRNVPPAMTYAEYVAFLESLPPVDCDQLRRRPLLEGAPFELP